MERLDIDIQDFIEKFSVNFESPFPQGITISTPFRDIPGWSSLQALIVVSSFEENYGVMVSAEKLANSKTIGDLFALVTNKVDK